MHEMRATVRRWLTCAATAALLLIGRGAWAWAESASQNAINTGDTAWVLMSTGLVLLMTPGLALFYAGMVRAKNVLSTIMQSLMAMALVTLLWVALVYSLAFAPGNPFIGGLQWAGLRTVAADPNPDYAATIPHLAYAMYQLMFAIITPALISGAVVERMKFLSFTIFIGVWVVLVYAPLAHMVWGVGGFLRNLGALDFAGGTVVHISSGASALVLALFLGRRRFAMSDEQRPHNLPMTVLGTGLLWFGWFGFNAGSALGANSVASNALAATHISASSAGFAWMLVEWLRFGKPTALGVATGAVAGLVAITPAAGFVSPGAAVVIGVGAALFCYLAIQLKNRLGYDDALDVFGVHGIGGIWGAMATGLFASTAINSAGANGLFLGGGFELVLKQAVGVVVALGMALVGTTVIAAVLQKLGGLRTSETAEEIGLDLSDHGETAYSGTGVQPE